MSNRARTIELLNKLVTFKQNYVDAVNEKGGSASMNHSLEHLFSHSLATLVDKNITANGTYNASDEGFNGTITWDGNIEGRPGISPYPYRFKVSDKVLNLDDFEGGNATVITPDETVNVAITTDMFYAHEGFIMETDGAIISAVAGAHEIDGDIFEVPEDGTYFMRFAEGELVAYVSSLDLPNAPTEIVDGFSSVTVNVETNLVEISETYDNNGTFEIVPPSNVIEWDGDTTGLDVYDTITDGKFYKVSDRTFTLEDLTHVTVELSSHLSSSNPYYRANVSFSDISTDIDSGYMYVWSGWMYVINGVKDDVEYVGTYFYGSTDEYVSKLTLPNAKVDGISKVNVTVDIPATYTVSSVDELPADAPDGSTGIVKQPVEGLKWRYLNWKGWIREAGSQYIPTSYWLWTDGKNLYASGPSSEEYVHYVLNGDTWESKVWNNPPDFFGVSVWTDGVNIYCPGSSGQSSYNYVLNGDTWEPKTWNGITDISVDGEDVWTDGTNIYYSRGPQQYVLNGDTWEPKTWNGITEFYGTYIWSDGVNIYHSYNGDDYVLNGDTWEISNISAGDGRYIWSDGDNIYYSQTTTQEILNGDTWEVKDDMGGLAQPSGRHIRNILGNVYYVISGDRNFILLKEHESLYVKVDGKWIERDVLDEGMATAQEITVTPTTEIQEITPSSAEYISKVTVNAIPPGTLAEISTEEEMITSLETLSVGSVYKYTGETTDTYENGAIYIVEEVSV